MKKVFMKKKKSILLFLVTLAPLVQASFWDKHKEKFFNIGKFILGAGVGAVGYHFFIKENRRNNKKMIVLDALSLQGKLKEWNKKLRNLFLNRT